MIFIVPQLIPVQKSPVRDESHSRRSSQKSGGGGGGWVSYRLVFGGRGQAQAWPRLGMALPLPSPIPPLSLGFPLC